jgi:aminoglycoside phosphotransferase (APT) family kinase protein
MNHDRSAARVAHQFQIDGELTLIAPYGSGHINDTYCAAFRQAGGQARFIVQRINTAIFKDPAGMMENIGRIAAHLDAKAAGDPDSARRVLKLIAARDGRAYHLDESGAWWRAYRFIEGAQSLETVETPRQAFEAAREFGRFQQLLADMPGPRLRETILDFHHTPKRFAAFENAVNADAAGRTAQAGAEIEFALARRAIANLLADAGLPERVAHNDAKINNVLLDAETGDGLCVIDLDTAMPGLALHDFGDMVRTATSAAMEDERDLSAVEMRFEFFEALARGYLSAAGKALTGAERRLLAAAGKVITFEQGLRFLTDHLQGDTYYKVHRAGHNLDRCRTQFRLLESMERQEDAMMRLVAELSARY